MNTIQIGMSGRTVRTLQQALVDEGYEIDVDGDFGEATDAALRDYQSNNDLTVDGIAGPDTWAALGHGEDEGAKASSGGQPMIEAGSRGDAVRDLQAALAELGWELDVDGIFGDATDEAVREFQEENELDADGVVGPLTWAALGF